MPATPELIAAYEKALYVVFGRPELVIRIGEPNPDLDELLEAEGAATAAYITAANPGGVATSPWKNEIANAALAAPSAASSSSRSGFGSPTRITSSGLPKTT